MKMKEAVLASTPSGTDDIGNITITALQIRVSALVELSREEVRENLLTSTAGLPFFIIAENINAYSSR